MSLIYISLLQKISNIQLDNYFMVLSVKFSRILITISSKTDELIFSLISHYLINAIGSFMKYRFNDDLTYTWTFSNSIFVLLMILPNTFFSVLKFHTHIVARDTIIISATVSISQRSTVPLNITRSPST
jgi:hypothetical protein